MLLLKMLVVMLVLKEIHTARHQNLNTDSNSFSPLVVTCITSRLTTYTTLAEFFRLFGAVLKEHAMSIGAIICVKIAAIISST